MFELKIKIELILVPGAHVIQTSFFHFSYSLRNFTFTIMLFFCDVQLTFNQIINQIPIKRQFNFIKSQCSVHLKHLHSFRVAQINFNQTTIQTLIEQQFEFQLLHYKFHVQP